jgi:hypothetical protein
MPKKTQLVRDDAYEEVAATYQLIQVFTLNEVLKVGGITSIKTRRKICEQFAFAMGNFHDQYWFKSGDQKYYPLLCFSEKFLNTDTKVAALGKVLAPSSFFAFHEYVSGAIHWYFTQSKEDASEIEAGTVGEEDA